MGRHAGARSRRPSASPPTAPAIPIITASLRSARARVRAASRDHSHRGAGAARVPRQSGRTAATTASTSSTRRCLRWRATRGIAVIADGSNADDRGDYRPGRQAAREFGVRSPLDEADLTKDEIRELSRRAGLPTWDEPASACLSSRIPYHSEVTDEKLRMIERAESARARARLPRLPRAPSRLDAAAPLAARDRRRRAAARARARRSASAIVRELRAIGYQHVTIDLQGYRMGSLNEGVRLRSSERARMPVRSDVAAVCFAAHLRFSRPRSKTSTRSTSRSGCATSTSRAHQPHPPGYPVYIALGTRLQATLQPSRRRWDPAGRVSALAIWSALAGAVALFARRSSICQRPRDIVDGHCGRRPSSPPVRCSGSPGLRPMSDMPGLALALAAQALLLDGTTSRRRSSPARWSRVLRLASACRPRADAAAVRARAVSAAARGSVWILTRPVAALAAGGLAWAVPLIALSGGLDGYLVALGTQAGEDFAWAGMLWTKPTPRRLLFALYETFVLPWDSVPLAIAVGVLALIGLLIALARHRRAVLLLLAPFGPYALFHLLFQETVHVRYALPTLPVCVARRLLRHRLAGRAAPVVSADCGCGAMVRCAGGVALRRASRIPLFVPSPRWTRAEARTRACPALLIFRAPAAPGSFADGSGRCRIAPRRSQSGSGRWSTGAGADRNRLVSRRPAEDRSRAHRSADPSQHDPLPVERCRPSRARRHPTTGRRLVSDCAAWLVCSPKAGR